MNINNDDAPPVYTSPRTFDDAPPVYTSPPTYDDAPPVYVPPPTYKKMKCRYFLNTIPDYINCHTNYLGVILNNIPLNSVEFTDLHEISSNSSRPPHSTPPLAAAAVAGYFDVRP